MLETVSAFVQSTDEY